VELPRQRREEVRPLTAEEAQRFLDAATGTRYGVLFEVLLATELRPGEALGLKWADVDEAGRVHVQRALTRAGDFEEPKTARGRRVVPLPASTAQARPPPPQGTGGGTAGGGSGLGGSGPGVHHGDRRARLPPRNLVRRHFKPLLEAAGLPATVRLYDLRQTCATLLLAVGENPKIVSERLGHASVALTLDTYSHVLPDMQESAAAKLEAALYGKGKI